eukprot:141035-Chlamydomonas_euryale.AAC.4
MPLERAWGTQSTLAGSRPVQRLLQHSSGDLHCRRDAAMPPTSTLHACLHTHASTHCSELHSPPPRPPRPNPPPSLPLLLPGQPYFITDAGTTAAAPTTRVAALCSPCLPTPIHACMCVSRKHACANRAGESLAASGPKRRTCLR